MVHELGHSLGLSHSDVRNAIMAPFYRGWDPFLKLSDDDKRAIQALYGQKVNKQPPRDRFTTARPNTFRPPSPSSSSGNICSDPKIDAIVQTADTTSYVFKRFQNYLLLKCQINVKMRFSGRMLQLINFLNGRPSSTGASTSSSGTWHTTTHASHVRHSTWHTTGRATSILVQLGDDRVAHPLNLLLLIPM